MPNWCENELKVKGTQTDIAEFVAKVRCPPDCERHAQQSPPRALCEQQLIPYPKKFLDMDKVADKRDTDNRPKKARGERPKDGFNSGGYEWCASNWGTKWGFCEIRAEKPKLTVAGPVTIRFNFNTAWAPPTPLIAKMSEKFPRLKFDLRYYEGGMGYKGHVVYERGEIVKEASSDHHGHRGG